FNRVICYQLLDDVVGLLVVVDCRDLQDREHFLLVQTHRQRVRGDVQRGDLPHELGEGVAVALVVDHRAVAEVRDVRGLGEQALELRLVQRLGGEGRGGGGEGGADDGDRAAAGQHGAAHAAERQPHREARPGRGEQGVQGGVLRGGGGEALGGGLL